MKSTRMPRVEEVIVSGRELSTGVVGEIEVEQVRCGRCHRSCTSAAGEMKVAEDYPGI